jgi:hypothetical protein
MYQGLFILMLVSLVSPASAGFGKAIVGDVISQDKDTLIVIADGKRYVLDNTLVRHSSITENCRQRFVLTSERVKSVSAAPKHLKVACTNRITAAN